MRHGEADVAAAPVFDAFVAIDWSGAKGPKQKGIAIAEARLGSAAPELRWPAGEPGQRWSRAAALEWTKERLGIGDRVLLGFDLSPGLPYLDRQGYFPGHASSPPDARALWNWVDAICADEGHFGANSFLEELQPYFRVQRGRSTITGDLFGPAATGRLRVVENRLKELGMVRPYSCMNIVGAAQVGKSSLTGMRVFRQLQEIVPIWPFHAVRSGASAVVEIYTSVAAAAAEVHKTAAEEKSRRRTKVVDHAGLAAALKNLDSQVGRDPGCAYPDHQTDALISAVWLRKFHSRPELWSPDCPDWELVARTEGWTFGIA